MKLIKIMNNFHKVNLGDIIIYFSYETPIGFTTPIDTYYAYNEWSQTTGKHVNWIKNNIGGKQMTHSELMDMELL